MKFNIFKPISSLAVAFSIAGLSLVTQQNSALASPLGQSILGCFHPTAVHDDDTLPEDSGEYYEGKPVGTIYFRGALTDNPYYMKYIILYSQTNGQRVFKVQVIYDTALFLPSEACRFNSWTEY